MQYEFDTPMTSQKSIPGAVSKATCLTREDAMTASRCMCLSWCLRSTCDDFFQAKETSIKGRLIKVRLESLGTAIFQRSTYIHWQLTIEACHLPTAAVSKKNPLWTSIHQYMKYSTTWPQLFLFTTIQNQTVPHASIPWNQSAKSWPELSTYIWTSSCQAKCDSWERGGASSTEGTTSTYWRSGPVVGA